MSSITLNSNLAALNAQRRLGQSTRSLQSSFERLSSGLRINRAKDDAAGLAIASGLSVDRRVLNQGIRNINDGLSVLAIADGAVAELSTITIRLAELAEQSANGALSNRQRGALDDEAQALADEYVRIAQTTEFNDQQVLGSDFGELRVQAGFGDGGGIISALGGAIGTGEFSVQSTITTASTDYEDVKLFDVNGDGHQDAVIAGAQSNEGLVFVELGNGDGSFNAQNTFDTGGRDSFAVEFGDFNSDGIVDLATGNQSTSGSLAEIGVLLGNGDGTFKAATSLRIIADAGAGASVEYVQVGDVNGDGIDDIVSQGGAYYAHTSIFLGNGDGSFRREAELSDSVGISYSHAEGLELVDLNGDAVLDIVALADRGGANGGSYIVRLGNGDGTFNAKSTIFGDGLVVSSLSVGDINQDGIIDIAHQGVANDFTYNLGRGDGTFESARNDLNFVGGRPQFIDINGDGLKDLASNVVYLANQDGSFKTGVSLPAASSTDVAFADLNEDGALDAYDTRRFLGSGIRRSLLSETTTGVSGLVDFSLKTQTGAKQALPLFQQKLDQLSSQRGAIGAFEARISSALASTRVTAENIEAARSRITDADVAVESARLVRQSILQQAGISVLSQANQAPALALSLLG